MSQDSEDRAYEYYENKAACKRIAELGDRISALEAALREIAELEFCNVYEAAVIAREALKESPCPKK